MYTLCYKYFRRYSKEGTNINMIQVRIDRKSGTEITSSLIDHRTTYYLYKIAYEFAYK